MESPLAVTGGILRLVRLCFAAYPQRSAIAVASLILSGLLESVGILTLLPLVGIALGEDTAGSGISKAIASTLGVIGFQPTLGTLLSLIVVTVTAKALLTLAAMSYVGFVTAHVLTDLRLAMIRSLLGASWSHFSNQPVGRFANAISNQSARAATAYMSAWNFVAAVLQLIVFLLSALLLSWQMTLAAAIAGTVIMVALGWCLGIARRAGGAETTLLNSLIGRLTDFLQGMKPVKAMGLERQVAPLLEREAEELNVAQRRQVVATWSLATLQEPIIMLFLAVGLYFALTAMSIPLTQLVVLAIFFNRSVSRVGQLQKHLQNVAITESAFWSLRQSIAEATAARESLGGGIVPSLERGIELDRVNFAYEETSILRDLSLSVPARKITALVGVSGAGKTTVADLITGLLQPTSGRVLIDGVSMSEIDIAAWRAKIGYVPQELFLFHDSVLNNITLRDPAFGRAAVEAAIAAAEATDFVASLEHGIDTVIGERGMKLSGGQRQRISLARALLRRPALLILDEATSALDPATEAAVCRTLEGLAGKVTMLAVSHQPAIVDIADVCYRLQDGTAAVERSDALAARRARARQ
jgi:ATP-binding cassette subfamily C protein